MDFSSSFPFLQGLFHRLCRCRFFAAAFSSPVPIRNSPNSLKHAHSAPLHLGSGYIEIRISSEYGWLILSQQQISYTMICFERTRSDAYFSPVPINLAMQSSFSMCSSIYAILLFFKVMLTLLLTPC